MLCASAEAHGQARSLSQARSHAATYVQQAQVGVGQAREVLAHVGGFVGVRERQESLPGDLEQFQYILPSGCERAQGARWRRQGARCSVPLRPCRARPQTRWKPRSSHRRSMMQAANSWQRNEQACEVLRCWQQRESDVSMDGRCWQQRESDVSIACSPCLKHCSTPTQPRCHHVNSLHTLEHTRSSSGCMH